MSGRARPQPPRGAGEAVSDEGGGIGPPLRKKIIIFFVAGPKTRPGRVSFSDPAAPAPRGKSWPRSCNGPTAAPPAGLLPDARALRGTMHAHGLRPLALLLLSACGG